MPHAAGMTQWVHWLADHGVNGLVLEYEDRLPWRTWPGTFRPGLTLDEWQQVIAAARKRGMEVVPLIQTHGHLEWLLKHPRWAPWRENGCWNELCPQVDEVMPAVRAWLDEIVAIHGRCTYLHIGGDETWNLATCPLCKAKADASPDGKLDVYITHLERVAAEVAKRGMRPLLWADAFWRENRMDLVRRLPRDVVLCDWQYTGEGPWPTTQDLGKQGHLVLGSSAIRPGYDLSQCVGEQGPRIANIRGWRRQSGTGGVIHTTWGRTRSLLPMYGPWEGWLPAFLAAGQPDALPGHPLEPWVARVDAALTGSLKDVKPVCDELAAARFDDPLTDACRSWWVLALRWRGILEPTLANARTFASLQAVHEAIGTDPDFINHRRAAHARMIEQARVWEADVRTYFDQRQLTDAQEFIASRTGILASVMTQDWAANVVPRFQPRTSR